MFGSRFKKEEEGNQKVGDKAKMKWMKGKANKIHFKFSLILSPSIVAIFRIDIFWLEGLMNVLNIYAEANSSYKDILV